MRSRTQFMRDHGITMRPCFTRDVTLARRVVPVHSCGRIASIFRIQRVEPELMILQLERDISEAEKRPYGNHPRS